MTIDGFWVVEFKSQQVSGSGVAIFSDGKMYGGETGFYYLGSYVVDEGILKARVSIRNFDPSLPIGFGIAGDFDMDVSAMWRGDEIKGTAVISNHPEYSLGIRMLKKADF